MEIKCRKKKGLCTPCRRSKVVFDFLSFNLQLHLLFVKGRFSRGENVCWDCLSDNSQSLTKIFILRFQFLYFYFTYEHSCNFYCSATTVTQNKGMFMKTLIWKKVPETRCHFSILRIFVAQKPRLDLSTALHFVTLFKNSLAWFLLLKNLWKTKCPCVNEWMSRQEL